MMDDKALKKGEANMKKDIKEYERYDDDFVKKVTDCGSADWCPPAIPDPPREAL